MTESIKEYRPYYTEHKEPIREEEKERRRKREQEARRIKNDELRKRADASSNTIEHTKEMEEYFE